MQISCHPSRLVSLFVFRCLVSFACLRFAASMFISQPYSTLKSVSTARQTWYFLDRGTAISLSSIYAIAASVLYSILSVKENIVKKNNRITKMANARMKIDATAMFFQQL